MSLAHIQINEPMLQPKVLAAKLTMIFAVYLSCYSVSSCKITNVCIFSLSLDGLVPSDCNYHQMASNYIIMSPIVVN